MKRFFLFALVATMFAACITDVTQDVAVELTPDTLTVSFEGNDSRIQLQNGKTVWTQGDLVSVFYRSDAHDQYEFQGETGDTEGTLKRTQRGTPSVGLDKIVAVYPYNSNYLIELLTGNIQAFLPATQNYAKDSYGIGSSIMISSSRTNTLYMKNVCGWLKVQLKGEGQIVKSITIKGNNGEQVAGNVFITADTAECTLATALNGADENNSGDLVGTLVEPNTILTEVTLDCGEGVELGAEPTAFYIALPPQSFENGFTIEITASDDAKMTKSTSNSITIERNAIQPMAAFELEVEAPTPSAPNIPNNEIWYTATEQISFWDTPNFDANIIAHDWDSSTGKGVIKFDNDITSIGSYAFRGGQMSLTSIILPNSVISIGDEALSECQYLTEVILPNKLEYIGDAAFWDCVSLKTITIPESVKAVGFYAFVRCPNLRSIYGKFASADNRCLIVDDILISFAPAGLTKYSIPEGVKMIGGEAFCFCANLVEINIPNGVEYIAEAAFAQCESLTNVTIPDSVLGIDPYAFVACYNLTGFYGKFASEDNRCLVIDGMLVSFAPAGVTEYAIPNNVNYIVEYAFESCEELTTITIPDSVAAIGEGAFIGCSSLKEVYCKPTTPPAGSDDMFDYNAPSRKIYVPRESVEAYKAAEYWSDYASDIEGYDF